MGQVYKEYAHCRLCPRNCGADRRKGAGYCRQSDVLRVARAALHMWEEPCISGESGSGTVFFSGCNMGCVFCQNRSISRGGAGRQISLRRLVEIFFELKDMGACNINLVTADIYIPAVADAIHRARMQNIGIPFVFNTSSYLNVESLKRLDGLIDIYLPDFKYIRDRDAIRYSNAGGYVEAAKDAVSEMVRQQPVCVSEDGLLKKGVIVRHLLMPGMLIQAKMIVKYLYGNYNDRIIISLMNQYTPDHQCLSGFPEIDRKVTEAEYKSLVDYAAGLPITNGYIQEGDTAKESFIPQFDCTGV